MDACRLDLSLSCVCLLIHINVIFPAESSVVKRFFSAIPPPPTYLSLHFRRPGLVVFRRCGRTADRLAMLHPLLPVAGSEGGFSYVL